MQNIKENMRIRYETALANGLEDEAKYFYHRYLIECAFTLIKGREICNN